ncbi:MAG TPA: transglutaminase family protein [Gemmataceae bacterium]|nr:transglutaminase family protein [Gemmataceae bacterium]
MAIRVALNHQTEYRYDRLVTLDPHVVRLRPASHCRTPILSYSLTIQPTQQFLNWQQDPYSNYLARLVFDKPTRTLRVEVDLVAEMTAINPFDFFIEKAAEQWPFTYEAVLAKELRPFLEAHPAGPRLEALIAELRREKITTLDYLVEINRRLHQIVRYIIRMEPGIQTCEETLTSGSGSCRDSAWLLVQVLRHLGLAARFVSGYLIQLSADEKSLDGPSGPEHDFTDLHAWAEVYAPGAGWIGLDPTSGLLAAEGHLPLACAADPINAAPITGSFGWDKDPAHPEDKCDEEFHVRMSVTRLHEDLRVTRPYTDEQWQAIDSLGRRIDAELRAGDVRLTMGGEPTFVSIDDRDDPEWNTVALGPGKRQRAGELLRRLRDRFARGGLLHFGQGKWYPGESLPRWALGCWWRLDGTPVWSDPKLVADDDRNYGFDETAAQRFVTALAERLGVDPSFAIPGYEDVWYYLWRERKLPINVDPLENRLDDPEERRRLAKVFEQGLDKIVGYALPLQSWPYNDFGRWVSGRWFLRREHMYLIPGDSPMGFRLPLDALPWLAPEDRELLEALDPLAPRGPLPPRSGQPFLPVDRGGPPSSEFQVLSSESSRRLSELRTWNSELGLVDQTTPDMLRTALCVEPRQGCLHVFMPPQRFVEPYLDLVAAVEDTAAELGMPVLLEGYEPPHDPRLSHFKITPDPGVLEVNIHPSHDWDELAATTNILYEEARLSRLSTEKYLHDGRVVGTGGGNHVILGGPTAADSPILRRPDLLRSLLGYWHNHPSLSYLFSSLFLGPTSQAPRVDEARNDNLYELELAFRQIPDRGGCAPWLVDRVFRHLLVDVTGNTHRTEFCIDKLYAPETSSGRRGLVELRSFEMPPHARMSLVQQLLLRSLVARFWKAPYTQKLARWSTELHDRFMLPHFIHQDFQDVLYEMRQLGYPLQEAWFAPHFEFRFPCAGSVEQRGVQLELRHALEPWHALGEEATGSGQARYVDSSVERVQVKVNGLTDARHVITCNGRRLPLYPTGVNGEYVAGVRYRAWQPPSCLHPTISVHTPLVFDILDTWLVRSLGGCSYYVAHPGGRSYETAPVNGREAEGRRLSRFSLLAHTPGPMTVPPEERQPECPLTLDLRQPIRPVTVSAQTSATEPLEVRTRPSAERGANGAATLSSAERETLAPLE